MFYTDIHEGCVKTKRRHQKRVRLSTTKISATGRPIQSMFGSRVGFSGTDLNTICEGNAMCKYADDTYVIIPAVNVDTRSDELNHISDWGRKQQLKAESG